MSERIKSNYLLLTVLFCTLGSAGYLVVCAHRSRSAERLYLLNRSDLIFRTEGLPETLCGKVEESIRRCFPQRLYIALTGGKGIMLIRSILMKSGWVNGVQKIAISDDDRLISHLRIRRPYAWLQIQRSFLLIDTKGRPLPYRASFRDALQSGLLMIRGADTLSRIREALSLCKVIYANKSILDNYGLRVVFLERTSYGRYNLISTDGRVFEWGYPPTGRVTPYLTVKEKMKNMIMVLKNPLFKKSNRAVIWTRASVDTVWHSQR